MPYYPGGIIAAWIEDGDDEDEDDSTISMHDSVQPSLCLWEWSSDILFSPIL